MHNQANGHFKTFEDLEVYQVARDFRKAMYEVSRKLPDIEKFGLAGQIRRAAVSVTNNIAEGHGRHHYLDQLKFLLQARGFIEELIDDLNVCLDEHYLLQDKIDSLKQLGWRVHNIINGYGRYLRQRKTPADRSNCARSPPSITLRTTILFPISRFNVLTFQRFNVSLMKPPPKRVSNDRQTRPPLNGMLRIHQEVQAQKFPISVHSAANWKSAPRPFIAMSNSCAISLIFPSSGTAPKTATSIPGPSQTFPRCTLPRANWCARRGRKGASAIPRHHFRKAAPVRHQKDGRILARHNLVKPLGCASNDFLSHKCRADSRSGNL